MTDAGQRIASLTRDIRFITREVGALSTSDFEAVDAILRTLGGMKAELEALRLSLAPAEADELVAA